MFTSNSSNKSAKSIFGAISAPRLRLWILILGAIMFFLLSKISVFLGFSLEYFYILLIALAGFWFGIKGGVIAALAGSGIVFLELGVFRQWAFRDLFMYGLSLRIFIYFFSGIIMGFFSETEKRVKNNLKLMAYYDELTECVNFRWTMNILETEVARARRYGKGLTIAMVDVDHFKSINDRHGHLGGNEALKHFASVLKSSVRNVDFVGRYGGEEFLLIFPEINPAQAGIVMNRIRHVLLKKPVRSDVLSKGVLLKFSAGLATFPYNGSTMEELVSAADNALYQAKHLGRDRIIVERRRWTRIKPTAGLRMEIVEPVRNRINGFDIANISRKGVLLSFPGDIIMNEFSCRLCFSKRDCTQRFRCRIVHKDKEGKTRYKVGAYFLDIPEAVQQRIDFRPETSRMLAQGFCPVKA